MKKRASVIAVVLFAAAIPAAAYAQVASVPATQAGAAPQAAPKPAAQPAAPIYDEKADAKADVAAALVRAGRENRRVLIQWGGNWCGWCRLLHKLFKEDRAIAKTLLYEYDVVMVDIGKFDKNIDLADLYKAGAEGFKKPGGGVPYLTVLDAAGRVVVNQETSSLESGQGHDPKKVLDFLNAHKAPALEAKAVLDKGLAEAKASGRRVFLHYGAPWCGWCKRLEAWMAQPEVAALLKKAFVDIKIDQDRMAGGMDSKKAFPASEKAGIPWFAALDPDGKAVATSTDSGENTGFPASDAEIAAFGGFLKAGAKGLTPADIETLLASLKAANKK